MALATFIHLFIQSNLEINCRFTSDQWKLNIWGLKFNHQVTKNGRFWHEFIELVELLIGKWDFLFWALGRWRIEIQNVHSFVPLLGGNVQLFFVTSKGRCWITNRFSRLRFTGNTMRRRIATNRYDPPIIMIISCKIMGPLWTKYFPTNHVLSFVKSLKKYSTNPPRPRKMSHLLLVTKLNERLNGQLFSWRIVYRCFHLELSRCEFTIKCASRFPFETNVWLQLWFSRAPFRMVVLHKSLTAAADRAIKRFRLIFGRKRIGLTCVCVEQW